MACGVQRAARAVFESMPASTMRDLYANRFNFVRARENERGLDGLLRWPMADIELPWLLHLSRGFGWKRAI